VEDQAIDTAATGLLSSDDDEASAGDEAGPGEEASSREGRHTGR
jgi:hypothetical protein